jgi:multicomponent Na+:H+ antiporter subunit E
VIARLATLAWLVLVWVLLWGELSVGNLLGGLAVGALLLAVFPLAPTHLRGRFRPLAIARLALTLLWKLIEANALVAWATLHPSSRFTVGIVSVPIVGASDVLITFVANALTLTPGSVVLEVRRGDPTMLLFHVFDLRDAEAVRREVQRVEALAIRAFGSPAAVAALDGATSGDGDGTGAGAGGGTGGGTGGSE